jgi:hypothetical protein
MQAAASVASVVYAGNAAAAASGSPQTLSNVAIGTAAADRYVVVEVVLRTNGTQADASAVTVAGVSCTQIGTDVNSGSNHLSLWRTNSPIASGATANVVVTFTNAANIGVATWAVTGLQSTTPTDVDSTTTDAASVTSTVSAGGVIIAAAYAYYAIPTPITFGWTGASEDFDGLSVNASSYASGASLNSAAGGNVSVSADASIASNFMMIAASFR